eukprot:XP_001699754.1 predicted protein [Chlamydomonas reinhardtii]
MQTCFSPNVRLARPGALRSARTSSLVVVRSKGFGSETAKQPSISLLPLLVLQKEAEAEASTSKPSGDGDAAALEALEARIGFLPEAMDIWIQDNLYPNYSWVILGFLGLSSLYGLYKTGKLPGQIQKQ